MDSVVLRRCQPRCRTSFDRVRAFPVRKIDGTEGALNAAQKQLLQETTRASAPPAKRGFGGPRGPIGFGLWSSRPLLLMGVQEAEARAPGVGIAAGLQAAVRVICITSRTTQAGVGLTLHAFKPQRALPSWTAGLTMGKAGRHEWHDTDTSPLPHAQHKHTANTDNHLPPPRPTTTQQLHDAPLRQRQVVPPRARPCRPHRLWPGKDFLGT